VNALRQKGFTLIESLVALGLVSAILLPTSLWLYRSKASHAAWSRFDATQALEIRMNRALVLRAAKDVIEEIQQPRYLRIEIRAKTDGPEVKLLGVAKDRKEKILARQEACLFNSQKGPR
jgi:prepilin-type N-terminal cleavage/methylation domain-containing protein